MAVVRKVFDSYRIRTVPQVALAPFLAGKDSPKSAFSSPPPSHYGCEMVNYRVGFRQSPGQSHH